MKPFKRNDRRADGIPRSTERNKSVKKNLVVICLDTLRRDMIHHLGVDFIQTPNLDAFARQSIVFENAYGEGLPTIQFRRAAMTGIRSFPGRYSEDTRGLHPKGMGWHKVPPV